MDFHAIFSPGREERREGESPGFGRRRRRKNNTKEDAHRHKGLLGLRVRPLEFQQLSLVLRGEKRKSKKATKLIL